MTEGDPCGFPGCRYFIRKADVGWVHLDTDGLPTGHTPRPQDRRFALIERLAHQAREVGARYTTVPGAESNSERVLTLTIQDAYSIGDRISQVIATGEDPGDSRYACQYLNCDLHAGHSAPHNLGS